MKDKLFRSAWIAAMVLLAVMMSCNSGSETKKLTDSIDSVNKRMAVFNGRLPITLANDDVIDSVYYVISNKTAVFNYIVYDPAVDVEQLGTDIKAAKQLVISALEQSAAAREMYVELAQNDVAVNTVIMNSRSTQRCTVTLTPQEILTVKPAAVKHAEAGSGQAAMTSRDSLDAVIDSINALCPDSLDRFTELTRVQIENNYVVYNYVRQETKNNSIDKQNNQVALMKAARENELYHPSPELQRLITLCIDNSLGIKHRIVGRSTRQTQDFAFDAPQLSKISKHPLPEGYVEITERTEDNLRKIR